MTCIDSKQMDLFVTSLWRLLSPLMLSRRGPCAHTTGGRVMHETIANRRHRVPRCKERTCHRHQLTASVQSTARRPHHLVSIFPSLVGSGECIRRVIATISLHLDSQLPAMIAHAHCPSTWPHCVHDGLLSEAIDVIGSRTHSRAIAPQSQTNLRWTYVAK